jgi:hypothetical protein
MATTTNYGWTTPDDTALVKDGASAIRTLGSSVDTTTKALNPSTTLGDIEYRSSTANTNTRLGIGTTGQVLNVSGGVPAWTTLATGGMTLLSTTTLSGATTTISGISGSYKLLYGVVYGVTNATASGYLRIAPNGSTTLSTWVLLDHQAIRTAELNYILLTGNQQKTTFNDANNIFSFRIDNYASATNYKSVSWDGTFISGQSGSRTGVIGGGGFESNTAITSLVFSNAGGNLSTGTVLLYGVN